MIHTHENGITCQDLLLNLSSYIDGDLEESMCEELKRHMEGCQNCRVVFDTTTRTIYLYQSRIERDEIPPEVRERLYSKLNLDDFLKTKA